MHVPRLVGSLTLAATVAALLAACGSSSSDTPGYCADRSDLQQSISDVKDVNITSGVSAIQSQLSKVSTNANALVSSAKSDFPQQTAAIKSSVSKLDASVKSLGSAPSATGAVTVGQDVAGVVSAVGAFTDATKDKC